MNKHSAAASEYCTRFLSPDYHPEPLDRWLQPCHSHRHEALEPGVEDALVASKLDALAAEYGHLLSSQLESQRAWYDARQAKAVAAAEAGCAPLSSTSIRLYPCS